MVCVAATNRLDVLDDALCRPGRFDRVIHVGKPNAKGREAVLRVHTRSMPLGPGTVFLDFFFADFFLECAKHAAGFWQKFLKISNLQYFNIYSKLSNELTFDKLF